MNKKWLAVSTASVLLLGVAGVAAARSSRAQIEIAYQDIRMLVDGVRVNSPDEPFLYVEKGRTFVPARPLAEALGASVGWDPEQNAVTIQTIDHVESEEQGDEVVWKVPARTLTFKTPAGFTQDKRRGEVVGLEMLTKYNGTRVSVRELNRSKDTLLKERAHDFTSDLLEDISADQVQITTDYEVPDEGYWQFDTDYRISGTATVISEFPYHFAVRVIEIYETTWVIAAYGPVSQQVNVDKVVESLYWR